MTSFFARRSSLVSHYSLRGVWLVNRITGPITWEALLKLKRLHIAMGHKIAELEELGHWDRHSNTTAKPATTDTPTPETSKPTIGVAL